MADLPEWAIDDPAISGSILLLRRVPKNRVQSGVIEKTNFREGEPGHGLSVTVWSGQADLDDVLRDHDDFGIVCVPASAFRERGAIIVRVPLEGNPNHCEVFPVMSIKDQRALKAASRWVRYPPWVLEEDRQEVATLAESPAPSY